MTVEAMEVDAPEVQTPVKPLPPFGTVSILHIIKDAQQKHGLRHKDYDRYMGYCGRRIERVRTSLKFKHTLKGKRKNVKFTLRPVTVEAITEERFFDVVLFEAERCWAYAMALKQVAENDAESRKKFHKIRKLRKAVKHATQLETLAKQCDRADAATNSSRRLTPPGSREASPLSPTSGVRPTISLIPLSLYERLAGLTKVPEMVELFKTKCEEVRPQMKYCKFNCGETEAAMLEIISMKLEAPDLDYSDLPGAQKEVLKPQNPIFFDLALNYIKIEKEEPVEKAEPKTKGWFWE
ncbi:hypothetical protein L596_022761 [Steinernema carpocapsae]|uniref:Signal recognition particle subunit SRP68 n=1 Tax=Steinernema carpocapsae TaxID=34508 RepID=A0A4U5MP51_STECR|nr:hypothetical protein L596_022761 [Steinernema carpocapsae]